MGRSLEPTRTLEGHRRRGRGGIASTPTSLRHSAGRQLAQWPVVLTKTDGSKLKGKITQYDRDKVTMDVISKPKNPPVSTEISLGPDQTHQQRTHP